MYNTGPVIPGCYILIYFLISSSPVNRHLHGDWCDGPHSHLIRDAVILLGNEHITAGGGELVQVCDLMALCVQSVQWLKYIKGDIKLINVTSYNYFDW